MYIPNTTWKVCGEVIADGTSRIRPWSQQSGRVSGLGAWSFSVSSDKGFDMGSIFGSASGSVSALSSGPGQEEDQLELGAEE